MHVLLADDDTRTADFIRRGLLAEGWRIDHVIDGGEALEQAAATRYDVVLLDGALTGIRDHDLCRRLRGRRSQVPILMLTALDSRQEKLDALTMGADDFLSKPFDFDELIARIEALHRRATGQAGPDRAAPITRGALSFDRSSLRVTLDGIEIELSKKERDLLLLFLTNADRVLSRERILNAVWGLNADPLTNVVDVYVGRLRRKIGPEGERIVTLRNVGYRMS